MKITKKGEHPDTWTWEGTCVACGTVIECEGKEIGKICTDNNTAYGRKECPVCFSSTESLIFLERKKETPK